MSEVIPSEDLLADDVVRDPYTYFGALRESDPVHWNPSWDGWILTRYDDVVGAFADFERLSADRITPFYEDRVTGEKRSVYLPTYEVLRRWMVFVDPPAHTRLRRLIEPFFQPPVLKESEGNVVSLVDELLDDMAPLGEADFIRHFAYLLPVLVIGDMFGVPREDRDRIKGWSDDILKLVFGSYNVPDRHELARDSLVAFGDYLRDLIRQRRASPGDDLISRLMAAGDDGEALDDEEVVATCILLLFGGHETTTNLLANGLRALLQRPAELQRLADNPRLVRTGVDELLRFDSPSKAIMRIVRRDFELHGRSLQAGQKVLLVQASANRDPRRFEAPDELDVGRRKNRHAAFGAGIHTCIGAPLARVEGRLAFPRILERLPGLRLVEAEPRWHPTILNRALVELPVAWDPA